LGDAEDRKFNTFPIRYAISCYIEKILGYFHEDYNYSNVNRLLEVDYKRFIKYVACYPDRLEEKDFAKMRLTFTNEEIIHIILLVAHIKSRTQLTYFSSSLYEILKHID
jgi:sestrin